MSCSLTCSHPSVLFNAVLPSGRSLQGVDRIFLLCSIFCSQSQACLDFGVRSSKTGIDVGRFARCLVVFVEVPSQTFQFFIRLLPGLEGRSGNCLSPKILARGFIGRGKT